MRKASLTNALTKGVLDPDLSERTDLVHYYQGLVDGLNGICLPQGGYADRGGSLLVSDPDVLALGVERRMRRRLEAVAISAEMVTAVNGGIAEHLVDQDPATMFAPGAVSGTPFVLAEIDFADVVTIDCFDVRGFACTGIAVDDCLAVEWWDGAAWRALGGSLDVGARRHVRAARRTRRFAGWPGQSASARQWRVVLHGAVGAGVVSMDGVHAWREGVALSPRQIFNLARSDEDSFVLELTDRNIDVYRDGRWLSAIPVDIAAGQVDEIWRYASLDTAFLFHEDVATIRVQRQGGDGEWDASALTFTNVPELSSTSTFAGAQDEVQEVDISGLSSGDHVVLAVGGMIAPPVVYGDDAACAAAMAIALAALPGVAADGIEVTVAGPHRFRIAFRNDNGGRAWPIVSASVPGAGLAPMTRVIQRGQASGDGVPLFGATTGWPACGVVVQRRLLLAGFRAAPTSWAPSRVGDLADFQTTTDPMTADLAFVRALDSDMEERINAVYVGRHLQFFTGSGEWFVEARTLDATQVQNAVLATRHGAESAVPVVFADGATITVQKGGQTIRDNLWADTEQSYKADPLSLLAPHLVTQVVDMAHRPARSVRDGNQIFLVNADGSIAAMTVLRSQDVIAMVAWRPAAGAYRNAMVDVNHTLWLVVERDGQLYRERRMPDVPLDAATRVVGSGLVEITGLDYLEGREVWAYADDDLVGPLMVADRKVTLPSPAGDVYVGLAPAWFGTLPVERGKPNEERPFRGPARIYEVEFSLKNTGSLTVSTNGKPHREVGLTRADDRFALGGPMQTAETGDPTLPMLRRLYTGDRRVQGLVGWSRHPQLSFSRSVPAPVHIKAIRRELAHG